MGDLLHAFGGKLLDLVLAPLISAIAALLVGYLVQQLRKIGIELDLKQQARLKELAAQVVRSVEEQARRQPMSSYEKSEQARVILKTEAPTTDDTTIQRHIDAALPALRAELAQEVPKPSTPATFGRKDTGI